jgi:CheY-like chemotaxis protein
MARAGSVLIVDDDEDHRAVLGEVLQAEGCAVYTAENGKRALEVLEHLHPDLVVVDLMMPVMNGWDFCAAMERDPELSSIPVVVMSAVARFRPVGHMRVLPKPVRLDTLMALLDIVDAPSGRPG